MKEKSHTIVTIHVKDDANHLRKNFECNQEILLNEMHYFRNYISASTSSKDLDIAVHCEMIIFTWLYEYINHQVSNEDLTIKNVLSLLISADFLIMPRLVKDCTEFILGHLAEFQSTAMNLSIIQDPLVEQMAAQCSPELLLSHLRVSLQVLKGSFVDHVFQMKTRHLLAPWSTSISLFGRPNDSSNHSKPQNNAQHPMLEDPIAFCRFCRECYPSSGQQTLECRPAIERSQGLELTIHGELVSRHSREPRWSLLEFLQNLRDHSRFSWCHVYWFCFSQLHVFTCDVCHMRFSLARSTSCATHPGSNDDHTYSCCKLPCFTLGCATPQARGCRLVNHQVAELDDIYTQFSQLYRETAEFQELIPYHLNEETALVSEEDARALESGPTDLRRRIRRTIFREKYATSAHLPSATNSTLDAEMSKKQSALTKNFPHYKKQWQRDQQQEKDRLMMHQLTIQLQKIAP